jgi:hypothetical protein
MIAWRDRTGLQRLGIIIASIMIAWIMFFAVSALLASTGNVGSPR